MRFLGAVARQFSIGMVCYTRTAINYGCFIALTLEESSGALEPSASGSNNFLQPLQVIIQYKKPWLTPLTYI